MAQNANVMNEPSTDEILTSIREIIEEFTIIQLSEEAENIAPITDVNKVANHSVKSDQDIAPQSIGQVINALGHNGASATLKFEEEQLVDEINMSREERLSVDEAMNALARRIGLNIEENQQASKAVQAKQQVQVTQVSQPEQKNQASKEEQQLSSQNANDIKVENVEVEDITVEEIQKKIEAIDQTENQPKVLSNNTIKSEIQSMIADEKFFEQAESMVDGIVRPVLREWLDKNLSLMMERILRDEVAKSLKLDK